MGYAALDADEAGDAARQELTEEVPDHEKEREGDEPLCDAFHFYRTFRKIFSIYRIGLAHEEVTIKGDEKRVIMPF